MKKKLLRNAGLVALSAVMAVGVAVGATACGGGETISDSNPTQLSVYIYCNAADKDTNQRICDEWAAQYNKEHGTNISAKVDNNLDKSDYYTQLANVWQNPESASDIIYLAPKYVKAYVQKGRILDLTEYLDEDDYASVTSLWSNSINYYGYIKGQTTYTMGQEIVYNANGANGAGYYTASGNEKVGLYALPKDYSNFSMGFNRLFFTDTLKQLYTTTKATTARTVQGPKGEGTGELTSKLSYSAFSGRGPTGTNSCVVYAASGTYTNPYTGQTLTVTEGEAAPLINIGVPTTYYPFNFYRFTDFQTALAGGDPMALLCQTYTNGKGYTVTIPGFPDETFSITDSSYQNTDASYDYKTGHIVLTYAEYSAMLWATSYFLNTFSWQAGNGNTEGDITNGTGGVYISTGSTPGFYTVYGGEQYEGSDGSPLYLLPWLSSNDADLIDATSQYCTQFNSSGAIVSENVSELNIASAELWREIAGTATNDVEKMTITGQKITRAVQYGCNSENFIETYGAFLALSSDWNGNPMGDTDQNRPDGVNGWSYFRAGRSLFYGAGSWDPATRNDYDYYTFQFGQMPMPIAEKYALYSNIKGANYEMQEYSNDPDDVESSTSYGDAQRSDKSAGKKIYNSEEIIANQSKRQDKWAARMDSVGYAVVDKETITGKTYSEESAWKKEASVSLCLALTANEDAQVTLTYGGAQLPNFVQQCEEFFNYQSSDYQQNGAFCDMITPEGFSTTSYYNADGTVNSTGKAEADAIWTAYYQLAIAMAAAANEGGSTAEQTVSTFISNYQSGTWQTAYNANSAIGSAIKYDSTYADTALKDTVSSTTTGIAFAMKILRMVTYTRSDRDLNIRMQCGLNAVRDSSMYTYDTTWMGDLDSRQVNSILAYDNKQVPLKDANGNALTTANFASYVKYNPADAETRLYETPAVFCFRQAAASRSNLVKAINREYTDMK